MPTERQPEWGWPPTRLRAGSYDLLTARFASSLATAGVIRVLSGWALYTDLAQAVTGPPVDQVASPRWGIELE